MTAADISPGALCFELTETAAMSSLAASTRFIRELRARGCRFSLDDFGSGLSSFMFLKNLPVDFLKIDGQFVHNVANDTIDRSMVEAITQIGSAMGIATIAERVDSADVLNASARSASSTRRATTSRRRSRSTCSRRSWPRTRSAIASKVG